MFTLDNTSGFDQKTLDRMNSELSGLLSAVDVESEEYADLEKAYSDQIFNKYC